MCIIKIARANKTAALVHNLVLVIVVFVFVALLIATALATHMGAALVGYSGVLATSATLSSFAVLCSAPVLIVDVV
jgi:hypothetical protein